MQLGSEGSDENIRIYHECEGRIEDRRLASRGLPSNDKR